MQGHGDKNEALVVHESKNFRQLSIGQIASMASSYTFKIWRHDAIIVKYNPRKHSKRKFTHAQFHS